MLCWFRGYKFLFILTGLVLALMLASIIITPLRINQDAALFLIAGRLILEGNTPYVDFIELNPPLIYYFNVIPNFVARLLAVNAIPVFTLIVFGLIIWSILTSYQLLTRHPDPVEKTTIAAIAFAVALSSFRLLIKNDYGQREHLFITLFLPMFVLRWQRYHGRTFNAVLAAFIGVMNSLGTCFKPHFLLAPISVEIYWLLKYRRPCYLFSPEMIGFASFGIVYALHFLLIPAEMRDGYIEFMRFIIQQRRYRVFGDWTIVDLALRQANVLVIGLVPLVVRRRDATRVWSLLESFGILALAGVGICAIQRRGYYYHEIPAETAALLMASVALFEVPTPLITRISASGTRLRASLRLINLPRLLLQIGLLLIFLYWSGVSIPNLQGLIQRQGIGSGPALQAILEYTEEGDSIFLQSTAVQPYRMIAQTNRTLGATYLHALPPVLALAGLEYGPDSYDPAFPLDPMLEKYLTDLEEDIAERQPRLVVIDNVASCTACPNQFSLWEFLYHRGFVENNVMPTYTRVWGSDRVQIYRYIGPPPSEMEAPILFSGELALYAWDLQQSTTIGACQPVTLRSWWRAEAPISTDYHLLLVMTEEGQGVASTASSPANWDTHQWHAGSRFVDEHTLEVPCDIAPGEYSLLIGVYDAETIELLPVSHPDGTPIGEYYYVTALTVN